MKRVFNIYDALFVLFLYFKLSGVGPSVSWFEVFIPYILEAVIIIAGVFYSSFSIGDRIKFAFYQAVISVRIASAAKKAKKQMDKIVTRETSKK